MLKQSQGSTMLSADHVVKFWLNDVAPKNIPRILVTDAVFQDLISLLNDAAEENIPCMLVTAFVFQLLMGWLNTVVLG